MASPVCNPRYKITLAFLPAEIFKSDLPIYFLLIRILYPELSTAVAFIQPYHCNFISLFSQLNVPLFYHDLMFINVLMLQFNGSSQAIIYYYV